MEAIAERGISPGTAWGCLQGSGLGHPLTYAQLDSVGVVGPAQEQADENHRDPVEHPPAPPPHTARARGRHLPAAHTCPAPPPPPPAGLARGRAWGSRITRRDRPGGGGRLRCGHCGRRGASSPSRGCERAPRTPAAQPGRGGGSEGEAEGDKEAGSSAPPPPGPRPVPASPPPTARRAAPSGWCGGSELGLPLCPRHSATLAPWPRATVGALEVATRCPPWPSSSCSWPWIVGLLREATLALGHPPQPQATPRAQTRIRGDSCAEERMMGDEQPQDSGWLQSHSSPARPRKDLSHKVLQSPGVLSGKFSLQLVGAGKLAERGQRATGSQNRPAK